MIESHLNWSTPKQDIGVYCCRNVAFLKVVPSDSKYVRILDQYADLMGNCRDDAENTESCCGDLEHSVSRVKLLSIVSRANQEAFQS